MNGKRLQPGDMAIVVQDIRGQVLTYEIGEEIVVKSIYGDECTTERPDGTCCMIGVPIDRLRLKLEADRLEVQKVAQDTVVPEVEVSIDDLTALGNYLPGISR